MQRRARVKAVANLTQQRKVTNKAGTENQQNQQDGKQKEEETPKCIEQEAEKQQSICPAIEVEQSNITIDKADDVNACDKNLDKLNETSSKDDNKLQKIHEIEPVNSPKASSSKEDEFKAPTNVSRTENEAAKKFRRSKVMPRLTIARPTATVPSISSISASPKEQEYEDENMKKNEEIIELPPPPSPQASVLPQFERQTDSPMIFSPPSTPFSPPGAYSNRSTPRDISDSPGLIINHNLHYPPSSQSPFLPIPHARIRTESICSLKSTTTVANLQPRKKVRTEDQKILDNKRESRERLSNKKIEKSQLRMFDMIYYNPSTNPMKQREVPKERAPKKIDLTAELPEPQIENEATAAPVPQLILNANGEMVLDETSLVVENEEQRKNRILLANTNVVLHDELTGSYGYYKRQQRTREWPQEETVKFFRCLNTVGTDFSLMLNLFPNRSRRDLKLKFKKEEKNNPNLVDKALRNHSIFDIEELQRELDQEDEARRKESESKSSEVKELVKRKILSKQEAKAKAQQQTKSKIEKILSDGDLILSVVDNQTHDIKENCENSTDTKAKPKRQTRKRKIKNEDAGSLSKKIAIDSLSIATTSQQSSASEFTINNNDSNIDNSLDIGMTQSFDSVITKKDERDAAIIHEFMATVRKVDEGKNLLANADDDFLSDGMIDTRATNTPLQNEQEIMQSPRDEEEESFVCDRIPKREIANKSPIQFSMKQEPLCKTETINQELDDESFLNSLDLERLVIVCKQVDGEDSYDIHETDAQTQKISDKPLKLPRHIVDLIVSVMTQDD